MATNVELRRSNGTDYNEVIHIATEVSLVSGLLGNDGKFKSELLPSYILGGMRYGGIVDLSSDPNLRDVLASKIHNDNKDEAKGLYFIVSKGGVVTTDTGSSVEPITHGYMISNPGDEGEYVSPVTLETGDWLVYEGYESATDNYIFRFNVVNNTYRNASTDSHGIVQLATDGEGAAGTISTKAMTPKSTVAAINARAYQHPMYTAKNETFSGVETLSGLSVNSLGHVTSFVKQAIRVASESQTGIVQLATDGEGAAGTISTKAMTPKSTVAAINARAYQHPTYTARDVSFSEVETLSGLSVNSLGHVTSFVKQAIRVASESQTGLIRLASSSEAKAATVDTKAISPLRVKEMIDKFASIELVQSLPTDMSDHPAGKLILLQI